MKTPVPSFAKPFRPALALRLAPVLAAALMASACSTRLDSFTGSIKEPGESAAMVGPGGVPTATLTALGKRYDAKPGEKQASLHYAAALRANGWDIDLQAHVRRGGKVFGVCGGYQMLGQRISDPAGIEGTCGDAPGLGLLDIETVLTDKKKLTHVVGDAPRYNAPFSGYEMHVGETTGPDCARPMLRLDDGRVDGAQAPIGCRVHDGR